MISLDRPSPQRLAAPGGVERRSLCAWRRFAGLGAALGMVALALGCDSVALQPVDVTVDVEDQTLLTVNGLEQWRDQGCVVCHCTDARGGCLLDSPSIQSVPLDLLMARLAEGSGTDHALKKQLPEETMYQIDRFLDGLDEPEPLAARSAVAHGYNMFAGADGCIQCHLVRLEGTSQVGLGPVLYGVSPEEIYYALVQDPCHPVQRTPPAVYPPECDMRSGAVTDAVAAGDAELLAQGESGPDGATLLEDGSAETTGIAAAADDGEAGASEVVLRPKHGPSLPGPKPGVIVTSPIVQLLTENPPPLFNEARQALAQFLVYIGPPPPALDPCAGEPPGTCTVDWAYIHEDHEVIDGAWNAGDPTTTPTAPAN